MDDHASCFCDDPAEARERFLAECLKAGLSPLTLPAQAAGDDTPGKDASRSGLFCDVVRLGAPSAHSAIILCSGAAGRSGLVNAGICTGLLANRIQRHLERPVSLVLVHAANPAGPIWPKPPADAAPVLVDGDAISKAEANWTRELLTAVDLRFGTELGAAAAALDAAQDTSQPAPETRSAWTRRDVKRIAHDFLSEAQFVLCLDFRTGLGQWAVPAFRNPDPAASAARGRARRWFGPLDGEESSTKEPDMSDQSAGGGVARFTEDAEAVSMIVDFGTFPGTGLTSTVSGRQQVRQDFPSQRDWRDKVYAQAEAIVLRSIKAAEEMADAAMRLKSAESDEF